MSELQTLAEAQDKLLAIERRDEGSEDLKATLHDTHERLRRKAADLVEEHAVNQKTELRKRLQAVQVCVVLPVLKKTLSNEHVAPPPLKIVSMHPKLDVFRIICGRELHASGQLTSPGARKKHQGCICLGRYGC